MNKIQQFFNHMYLSIDDTHDMFYVGIENKYRALGKQKVFRITASLLGKNITVSTFTWV